MNTKIWPCYLKLTVSSVETSVALEKPFEMNKLAEVLVVALKESITVPHLLHIHLQKPNLKKGPPL